MNMNEGPKDGAKGGEIEGRRWEMTMGVKGEKNLQGT